MDLALCGAGTDGAPGDKIRDVLTVHHIQKFGGDRQFKFGNLLQQMTGHTQAFVGTETTVQIRVGNQAFPANNGAWLFKIHPHQDAQIVFQFVVQFRQASGVFQCGFGIVNRAGADDHQKAWILTGQNGFYFTALGNQIVSRFLSERIFGRQLRR